MKNKNLDKDDKDKENPDKNFKTNNYANDDFYNKSKLVYGIIAGIFFFVIFGLIFGVISYPNGSFARRTFLKGWGIGALCTFIILILCNFIFGFMNTW